MSDEDAAAFREGLRDQANASPPANPSSSARYRTIVISCDRSFPMPSKSTKLGVFPNVVVGFTRAHSPYPTTSKQYGVSAHSSINLANSARFRIGMYCNQCVASRADTHRRRTTP